MSTSLHNTPASSFQAAVGPTLEVLSRDRVVDCLWKKDHLLWKPEPKEITDRLGWLTVHDQMRRQLNNLRSCVSAAKARNILVRRRSASRRVGTQKRGHRAVGR